MLSTGDLLKVAEAYCQATGLTLRGAGLRACGGSNAKALVRLAEGGSVNTKTAEAIEDYFRRNWPTNARWPRKVPGGPLARVAKFTAQPGTAKPTPPRVAAGNHVAPRAARKNHRAAPGGRPATA